MSYLLPHLHNGYAVDQAMLKDDAVYTFSARARAWSVGRE